MKKDKPAKRKRGRPVVHVIPPIQDTPERVAKTLMQGKPKKTWNYQKKTPH